MGTSYGETDMTRDDRPSGHRITWLLPVVFLLLGGVAGVAVTHSVGWQTIHGTMLTVYETKYPDVDQACEALKAAIEAKGFTCKAILDLNGSMGKHGVRLDRQVRVVEFGKAAFAHDMLQDNPEVSGLLPCGFGVYEGNDERIYISHMNWGPVGTMLGGAIAEIMGEQVAQEMAEALQSHAR